ncbi:MAG: hypothetical protein Mars2KO_13050 [Maribacter sp.]
MLKNKKIGITLTLTIVLAILFRTFLPVKKSNAEIRNEFWIKKTHQTSKNALVVGGNSRIYRGVSVKAINSVLEDELRGVNLGYSALGYSKGYLAFLESRLDLEAEHKIVLIGVDPGPLTKIAAQNKSFNSYRNINFSEVFKTLYINPYVTISTYTPTEIRNLFNTPRGHDGFIEDRKNYFAKYHEDGWVASYKIPNNPEEALPIYKKFADENGLSIDADLVEDLLMKIEELVGKKAIVIAFRPPSTKAMQEWENQRYHFDENDFKSKIEAVGGYWLEVDPEDYQSYDGAHLHYLSAEKLSKALGEKINKILTERK